MIYIRIVYYQETIVALLIGFHLYSWVLAIVLLNIQIIELNLSGDGSTSFTLNYRKFCDSCHICQFFLQRIIDMLAYGLHIPSKQLSKLLSIQPHRFVFQTNFELHFLIWLVQDYFSLVFHILISVCILNVQRY